MHTNKAEQTNPHALPCHAMPCHAMLVLGRVTLLQDLKRNGVDTPEAIYNIIYSGESGTSR